MTNLCYRVKGLAIAITGAIVLSGNSAIAQINQDATLTNKPGVITQEKEISERLRSYNLKKLLENYGISGDDVLQVKCDIDLTKIQVRDINHSLLLPAKHVQAWACLCNGELTDCPCPPKP
ncbi:hypothetical protein VF14_19120 [Nostoc linckia z18]|uniref:Uncharacterized protein n=2 Tax=Nostoc linckia TaxID=92942 RepID=A0A9Q5Z7W6_NOSLI|nr:hypothetical protein [Nostoc linckia]PHK41123.1 hypothetical protein VF12_07765 [Nostoc linckia z15]PHK44868.1 hypothetical protein VF13_19370 [Nostoc linckia z16]PHJ58219.1 hypothetical protein VF02_28155 [Nostoc linckia z1]PHJ64399.1 hypothetical protein VF03_29220 [Nostoc linckia z2]PHJ65059.1 hypothetical protein VF05_21150 [Nostoc linckia z3]